MQKKSKSLTPEAIKVVQNKGTEAPFSGKLNDEEGLGTYLCKQCGLGIFRSQSKFHSGCGWPSFDEEIPNAIKRIPDADGRRIEIVCNRCEAHLGHVFAGEGFTTKSIRHCVNSVSLDFVEDNKVLDTQEAIFAAGCFWGVEYYFKKLPGILKTEVGYTGGKTTHPTYEDICYKKTGHFEALRVIFDPSIVSFEKVTKYFFEIHDATQANGQGPDLGEQYLSAIFYYSEEQNKIALNIIRFLTEQGYKIATQVLPVSVFWPAEVYHQSYYDKTGKNPYCHRYTKIFPE